MKQAFNKDQKYIIFFSEAMNRIDERRDYNEYNEVNSSAYFKDTLYRAEDEIDKMMSSPLISNYRTYKKPKKLSMNMIKKNKNYILNKLFLLTEKAKKDEIKRKEMEKEKNKKKKKYKVNPIYERLSKIKINFSNLKKDDNDENQKNKLLLKTGNISTFPKINTFNKNNNKQKENKGKILLTVPGPKKRNFDENLFKDKIMQTSTNRYFAKTHEKNLDNWEDKPIRSSNNKFLKSMYQECLKRIDRLETEVNERQLKTKLNISPSKKLENQIFLENRIYNQDSSMNKYLIENINIFNKANEKKKVNIAKQIEDMKLKRDPILKLSNEFAYKNRKPLLSLFIYESKEEKENQVKKSPLAELKVKDALIMKNLEKDNRNKNLLIKRLEEDQTKYKKGGYFIITNSDSDIEFMKNNNEQNIKDDNDNMNIINNNKSVEFPDKILKIINDNDNNLYKFDFNKSQRNLFNK